MDYCNPLLFGLPNTLLHKLQHLQNSTANLITGKQKYDHNTPELIKLYWLPVKERISFKIGLLTFKCLNNLAPKYLSDLISYIYILNSVQNLSYVDVEECTSVAILIKDGVQSLVLLGGGSG